MQSNSSLKEMIKVTLATNQFMFATRFLANTKKGNIFYVLKFSGMTPYTLILQFYLHFANRKSNSSD